MIVLLQELEQEKAKLNVSQVFLRFSKLLRVDFHFHFWLLLAFREDLDDANKKVL